MAAETQADPESKADVGRSLTAVARLLEATGKTKEAEVTYRRAETLLGELAPTIAEAAPARSTLADCRSHLDALLQRVGTRAVTTKPCRSSAWRVPTRRRLQTLAPGRRQSPERDLADSIHRVARLLDATGKSIRAAEAEYRKELHDLPEAGRRQPRCHRLLRQPGTEPQLPQGSCWRVRESHRTRRLSTARQARRLRQRLADDNPRRHRLPQYTGGQPPQPGHPAVEYRQVIGSGGGVGRGALAIQQKIGR